MPTAMQLLTIKHYMTRTGCLWASPWFSSIVILSVTSLTANASTLISATEYLDYELPKTVQNQCFEKNNCPKIEVKYLNTNHDWINKIINARINNLVVNSKPSELPVSTASSVQAAKSALDDFAQSQISDLPNDSVFIYSLMVSPDYLGHVDNFELFEIGSYVYTGGAHGMPYSEYLILDPNSQQQVTLDEMLQVGQKSRFQALGYDAYKTWVKTVDKNISGYEKNWPFILSDNITLTAKGINIRYQHYDIGPYAYGMPVLSIPYNKLHGIIKPHFFPK